MNNGYWGKILNVDLTHRRIEIELLSEKELKLSLGGAGLGAWLLRRDRPNSSQEYGDDSLLIFATGPFQAAPVPGGAKFSIVGISPLTKTYADSAAGADFGFALKDAGYDALVIRGISDKPVLLHIFNDQVDLMDGSAIWGMDTFDTVDAVRALMGDNKLSVAAIGPAGERRVAIACIAVDKHSFAGRCGLGAVMGSKLLKAVAVRGTQAVKLYQPQETKNLVKKYQRDIHESVQRNSFRKYGTPGLCETAEGFGDMPIRYWEGDTWPEGARRLGGESYNLALKAKPYPCRFCPVGCHRMIQVTDPEEYAVQGIGPEYETLGMMGTNLLIDDPKAVAKANDIANRLGLDTISAGAMVGFAMECYEKGDISINDTGGLALNWGDPNALFSLLEQIGRKDKFGALFSEGTLLAARKINPRTENRVVHCKGLDLPAHDPRSCISLATSYATGTRGACHFRGPCEDIEMGGFFIPEVGITKGLVRFFDKSNQSFVAVKCQDFGALMNSLVLCMFMVDGGEWGMPGVLELFNAITGWEYSLEDLMLTGERIFTLQRLLNLEHGYGAADDVLPGKMFVPAKEGFRAGQVPPFSELINEYYRLRGWNRDGKPKEETLERLGL